MAKYKVIKHINRHVNVGDIIELQDPPIREYKDKLQLVDEDTEVKTSVINPNREELKARATELDISFASNIPTTTLIQLISEAEEKLAAEADSGNQE